MADAIDATTLAILSGKLTTIRQINDQLATQK